MAGKLHIYALSPIDFWEGWMTKEQYLASVKDNIYAGTVADAEARIADLVSRAEEVARTAGWEGDYRNGPYFSGIPGRNGDSETLVAWKQDNNGETFVASPYRLPWLEE